MTTSLLIAILQMALAILASLVELKATSRRRLAILFGAVAFATFAASLDAFLGSKEMEMLVLRSSNKLMPSDFKVEIALLQEGTVISQYDQSYMAHDMNPPRNEMAMLSIDIVKEDSGKAASMKTHSFEHSKAHQEGTWYIEDPDVEFEYSTVEIYAANGLEGDAGLFLDAHDLIGARISVIFESDSLFVDGRGTDTYEDVAILSTPLDVFMAVKTNRFRIGSIDRSELVFVDVEQVVEQYVLETTITEDMLIGIELNRPKTGDLTRYCKIASIFMSVVLGSWFAWCYWGRPAATENR